MVPSTIPTTGSASMVRWRSVVCRVSTSNLKSLSSTEYSTSTIRGTSTCTPSNVVLEPRTTGTHKTMHTVHVPAHGGYKYDIRVVGNVYTVYCIIQVESRVKCSTVVVVPGTVTPTGSSQRMLEPRE